MIPKRVTLKNFLSFGEEEQDFDFTDDEALWILTGPNGVGKSAVFDAITYCLFCQHRGGKSDFKNLIRHGSNGFRVSFEFELDGVDYRIQRSRGSNVTQRVERRIAPGGEWQAIPGVNNATEVDAWVSESLGLAYEAFTKSVLLRQGESDAIILARGTERLEMLKKIIDVERYEALSTRIANATKEQADQLKALQRKRDAATPVTDDELAAAAERLQTADEQRATTQANVLETTRAVDRAMLFEELTAERTTLDGCLREADERAAQRAEIVAAHERLALLAAIVPPLQRMAAARSRIATADEQRSQHAAALTTLNETLQAETTALEAARQTVVDQKAAADEHRREAQRLGDVVDREARSLIAVVQVQTLAEELKRIPADLDTRLLAAQEAANTAKESIQAAIQTKSDAESRLKLVQEQRAEFETVGAKCPTCRQPVSKKHADEERVRLERDIAELTERFHNAELALQTVRAEESTATTAADTFAGEIRVRGEKTAIIAQRRQTLSDLGIQSDPAIIKKQLEANQSAAQQHEASATHAANEAENAIAEVKRLEDIVKQQTLERERITADLQTEERALAAAASERDTLLKQLPTDWMERAGSLSDSELSDLTTERQLLESRGIAARFAALQRDSEEQVGWKSRREAIVRELTGLPALRVADATAALSAAKAAADSAATDRDAAKANLDHLTQAAASFRTLVAELAQVEAVHRRHGKLNSWLGKEGLLRDLVRDAEQAIVHHAQETLRNLSGGELDIELQDPSDGKDEALVLLVRRVGDPEPIPVRFLSGSQKFRVAVAIAVAIGKFAAGPDAARRLESVIIDEGFGSLDKDGLAAMREELEKLKNSETLKRVILVSHQEDFTSTFPVGYRLEPGENGTIASRFAQHGA